MSVLDSNRSVPLGAITTLRAVAFVERLVDSYAAWQRARQTAKTLADLSDKQLADIGLHRGDIVAVADQLAQR
jgi:uncharacterized protein YjiS (DUF1127 family)